MVEAGSADAEAATQEKRHSAPFSVRFLSSSRAWCRSWAGRCLHARRTVLSGSCKSAAWAACLLEKSVCKKWEGSAQDVCCANKGDPMKVFHNPLTEYYNTNKTYWGDQSQFALIPSDGSVGPPLFLKEGSDPVVVGRTTFFCNSPLINKVSRQCVSFAVVDGKVIMMRMRPGSRVRYRRNWAHGDWLALEDDIVTLSGGAIVQLYPDLCAFEIKDLRPAPSPEWGGRRGFEPASKKRLRNVGRPLRCAKLSTSTANVENVSTPPGLCPGCQDVPCSCVASVPLDEQGIWTAQDSSFPAPSMINVSASGESTPMARCRSGDYSDLEDDDRPPVRRRTRALECPNCQQPFLGGICDACGQGSDPDSHEHGCD